MVDTALWNTANLKRLEDILTSHRAVWDDLTDAVIVTNADPAHPVIVMTNRALLHGTGYALDEVLGQTPRMFQGPDTDPDVLRQIRQALEQGESIQVALINYRKDGTPFRNTFSVTPIKDPDQRVTHFVSVQRFGEL